MYNESQDLALQRSAMFPAMYATPPYVSLLWSEEKSFVGRVFYKHYIPTGRLKTPLAASFMS
jgi:hypothetical protein